MERRYWPIPVTMPPEQMRERDRALLRFFETAFREGFNPYDEGLLYGASADSGRHGRIVVRAWSRGRWEIWPDGAGGQGLDAFLDDLDIAADAVLRWLRGEDVEPILASIRDHLVLMPGATGTFRVYPENKSASVASVG